MPTGRRRWAAPAEGRGTSMDNRNHDDNLDNLNIDGNEDIARAVNAARQAKQNGSRIAADAAAALSGDGMGHAAESETQMDDLAAAVREATERVHGTEQQQPAPVDAEQPLPADAASQTPPENASEPEESLAEAQAPPADPAAPQDDADAVDMSDTIPMSAVGAQDDAQPQAADESPTMVFGASGAPAEAAAQDDLADTIRVDAKELKQLKKNRKKSNSRWYFSVLKGLGYAVSLLAGMAAVGLLIFVTIINDFEDPTMDELFANLTLDSTTTIMAYDKEVGDYVELQELYADENRVWVDLEDIPLHLQQALISIEDERFYEHNGVDWKRFGGAVIGWFTGNDTYGGSTLTQQLIKNLTNEDDVSWQRKAREVFRALYVERKFDKDVILEYYLNVVYFNYRAYGVGKAAELYFNKDVKDLTLAESASLVAIFKAPAYYEPYDHYDNNLSRRKLVLGKMLELGYITQEEHDQAAAEHLSLNPNGPQMALEPTYSFFVDQIIEDLIDYLSDPENGLPYNSESAKSLIYRGGLTIYATIDQEMQAALDAAYADDDIFPRVRTEEQYQSAMYIMDHKTGFVLAMAGGRGEKTTNRGHNRATMSPRQPGSALKPLSVYVPALEAGVITLGSVIDDSPVKYDGGPYPQNATRRYYGMTTMYFAIEQSLNATPARILDDLLGYEASFDFMYDKLRFKSLVRERVDENGQYHSDVGLAPLSMGALTDGVTVREMTAGYAAIANQGAYNQPLTFSKVEDNTGKTIIEIEPENDQVMSVENAWLMQELLQNGVRNGLAGSGRLSIPLASKTGTSNYNYDKWYMGFTPYFTAGLWLGYDENQNLTDNGAPATISGQVWKGIMNYIIEAMGYEEMDGTLAPKPDTIVTGSYCLDCGGAATAACSADIRGSRVGTAYYVQGTQPTTACKCHVSVYVCDESNQIAHNNCPKAHTVTMIDVVREFESNIWLRDGDYVFRNPGDSGLSRTGPVFMNLLPAGMYPGYGGGDSNNHLCTAHEITANPTLFDPNNVVSESSSSSSSSQSRSSSSSSSRSSSSSSSRPSSSSSSSQTQPEPEEFTVTLPGSTSAYTITPDIAAVTVDKGDSFTFIVTLMSGYTNPPLVRVNNTPLEGFTTDNIVYTYVVNNIQSNIQITVDVEP